MTKRRCRRRRRRRRRQAAKCKKQKVKSKSRSAVRSSIDAEACFFYLATLRVSHDSHCVHHCIKTLGLGASLCKA